MINNNIQFIYLIVDCLLTLVNAVSQNLFILSSILDLRLYAHFTSHHHHEELNLHEDIYRFQDPSVPAVVATTIIIILLPSHQAIALTVIPTIKFKLSLILLNLLAFEHVNPAICETAVATNVMAMVVEVMVLIHQHPLPPYFSDYVAVHCNTNIPTL